MFSRLINNTIYGGDDGILIEQQAAPTLLNNAVVNTNVPIRAVNAGNVIVGGTLLSGNAQPPIGILADPFIINASNQVFRDPSAAVRNFYPFVDRSNPALSSELIDSSIASRDERLNLQFVKNSAGIAYSPILAPTSDLVGRARPDDAFVNPSFGGQGLSIFQDRGALDSSDTEGPIAQLLTPLDNDRLALDSDQQQTTVFRGLGNSLLEYFAINLREYTGIGPDAATVTSDAVIVTENGRRLTSGVDYTFGYSETSRQIRLTPFAGVWRPDAVYEIVLLNQNFTVIQPPAAAGASSGFPFTGADLSDGQIFTVTGAVPVSFEWDAGYVMQLDQPLTLQIPTAVGNAGLQIGTTFTITGPSGLLTFQFTDTLSLPGVPATNIPVVVADGDSPAKIIAALKAVFGQIYATTAGQTVKDFLQLNPNFDDLVGAIHLGAYSGQAVGVGTTNFTVTGNVGVQVGEVFSYTRAGGTSGYRVFFELTDNATNWTKSTVPIEIKASDTRDQVANKIGAALRNYGDPALDTDLICHMPRVLKVAVCIWWFRRRPVESRTLTATQIGTPGVTGKLLVTLPAVSATALDRTTFSIQRGTSAPVVFEFSLDLTVSTGNTRILINATDTPGVIVQKIITAIQNTLSLGLNPTADSANDPLDPLLPASMHLNETFGYVFNRGSTGMLVTGISVWSRSGAVHTQCFFHSRSGRRSNHQRNHRYSVVGSGGVHLWRWNGLLEKFDRWLVADGEWFAQWCGYRY